MSSGNNFFFEKKTAFSDNFKNIFKITTSFWSVKKKIKNLGFRSVKNISKKSTFLRTLKNIFLNNVFKVSDFFNRHPKCLGENNLKEFAFSGQWNPAFLITAKNYYFFKSVFFGSVKKIFKKNPFLLGQWWKYFYKLLEIHQVTKSIFKE